MVEGLKKSQLESFAESCLEGVTSKRDSLVGRLDERTDLDDEERQRIKERIEELDTREEFLQFVLGETAEEGNSWARRLRERGAENQCTAGELRKKAFTFYWKTFVFSI